MNGTPDGAGKGKGVAGLFRGRAAWRNRCFPFAEPALVLGSYPLNVQVLPPCCWSQKHRRNPVVLMQKLVQVFALVPDLKIAGWATPYAPTRAEETRHGSVQKHAG